MYTGFMHLHSTLRYVVILFLVLAIVFSIISLYTTEKYEKKHKITALIGLISCHIQFLLGWIMYFMSGFYTFWTVENFMKDKYLRFWALEHPLTMTLGIILVTSGYSIAKRKSLHSAKLKNQIIFFTLGLILILISVPWPFREVIGRGWLAM
jgi:multisubunit Na+/H+ antiporter MnhB subunit